LAGVSGKVYLLGFIWAPPRGSTPPPTLTASLGKKHCCLFQSPYIRKKCIELAFEGIYGFGLNDAIWKLIPIIDNSIAQNIFSCINPKSFFEKFARIFSRSTCNLGKQIPLKIQSIHGLLFISVRSRSTWLSNAIIRK
jgi:hypothetical protein